MQTEGMPASMALIGSPTVFGPIENLRSNSLLNSTWPLQHFDQSLRRKPVMAGWFKDFFLRVAGIRRLGFNQYRLLTVSIERVLDDEADDLPERGRDVRWVLDDVAGMW